MDEIKSLQKTEPEPEARSEARLDARQMTWVTAALLESLVLAGGLYWIMSAPHGTPLLPRILLVVGLAVLGSAGFALAAARRLRPRT
jgi:hypothetical protein